MKKKIECSTKNTCLIFLKKPEKKGRKELFCCGVIFYAYSNHDNYN